MATHNRQDGHRERANRCGARDGADEEPGSVHEEAGGDACHHHVPARRVPRPHIRMWALDLLQLERIGFGAVCTVRIWVDSGMQEHVESTQLDQIGVQEERNPCDPTICGKQVTPLNGIDGCSEQCSAVGAFF